MASADYFRNLTDDLLDLAGDYVAEGGVKVSVKTNMGPEFQVNGGGGGLADALGLKAAVIVRSKTGGTITTYGDPPATEPLKVAALVAAVGVLGFLLLRGVKP